MLTINLDFYTDGYSNNNFDNYGQGRNFYPITTAQIESSKARLKIQIKSGGKTAEWEESASDILRNNTYRILEHPKLNDILIRKANLINIFRVTKSEESLNGLEKYMKQIVPILEEILETCHKLYWLNDKRYIRSPLSFDECLSQSIDFGYDKMRIMNLISSIDGPGILNSQINNQISDIVTNQYRALGTRESKSMSKKNKKK